MDVFPSHACAMFYRLNWFVEVDSCIIQIDLTVIDPGNGSIYITIFRRFTGSMVTVDRDTGTGKNHKYFTRNGINGRNVDYFNLCLKFMIILTRFSNRFFYNTLLCSKVIASTMYGNRENLEVRSPPVKLTTPDWEYGRFKIISASDVHCSVPGVNFVALVLRTS